MHDGAADGGQVGVCVGYDDGVFVGSGVGIDEGEADGAKTGTAAAVAAVGSEEGTIVLANVGSPVG